MSLYREGQVTYEELFTLKFKEHVPTCELEKRFPEERKKISEIALLELPPAMLRELVKQEKELRKLMVLKTWLLKKKGREFRSSSSKTTSDSPR